MNIFAKHGWKFINKLSGCNSQRIGQTAGVVGKKVKWNSPAASSYCSFEIREEQIRSMASGMVFYRSKVHLVYSKYHDEIFPIDELDISELFYKSTSAAKAAAVAASKKDGKDGRGYKVRELPSLGVTALKPSFIFKPFRSGYYDVVKAKGVPVFAPFGDGEDGPMILCADGMGHTVVHDTSLEGSTMGMPMMNAPKGLFHAAISVPQTEAHAASTASRDPDSDIATETEALRQHADSIYIMDMEASDSTCPFEVLSFSSKGWRWRPLPPPPFRREPKYECDPYVAMAVDGNTIFISPSTERRIGTYAFDTVTQEWEKAGEWQLPFVGKAEYVPELKHWFGISRRNPYNLCAVDALGPPWRRHELADLGMPEGAGLSDHCLLYLGSGRFCTVRFFVEDERSEYCKPHDVPVFTGVEVVRCDDQAEGPGIKMIKHKSMFLEDDHEMRSVI